MKAGDKQNNQREMSIRPGKINRTGVDTLESLKHNSRFYREALSTVRAGQNKIFSKKKYS
jgi:hypothetical protein